MSLTKINRVYTLHNRRFTSKEKVAEAVQEILHQSPLDTPLEGDTHCFVLALVQHHPRYEQKAGCGIDHIEIRGGGGKIRAFWIVRTDGTAVDISYKKCITSDTPRGQFRAVARAVIAEYVFTVKQDFFREYPDGARCSLSGAELTPENAHVDHVFPNTFEQLVNDFCAFYGIDDNDPTLTVSTEDTWGRRFASQELHNQWVSYHQTHAVLRVIHGTANAKLGNRPPISFEDEPPMSKHTYTLGNQTFSTKAAAETHLREILHRYSLGSRVEGDDHALLASILPNHPEAKEKMGGGVSHFEVHSSEYGTTCFFVVRTDGTKMPFSFRSCIKLDDTQGDDMTLATITKTALANLAKCNVQLALVDHLPKAQKVGSNPPDWIAAKLILEAHKGLLYHHLGLNIGMVYLFPTQDNPTVDQLNIAAITLSANIVDMRTTQQLPLPNEWHPKSLTKRFGEKYLVALDMPQLFNHLICRGVVVLCETTEQLQAQLQSIRFPFYPLTPSQPLEPRWLSYHLRIATMYELALIADDGGERGRLETIIRTIDDCYEASDERGMIAAFKGVFTPAQDW